MCTVSMPDSPQRPEGDTRFSGLRGSYQLPCMCAGEGEGGCWNQIQVLCKRGKCSLLLSCLSSLRFYLKIHTTCIYLMHGYSCIYVWGRTLKSEGDLQSGVLSHYESQGIKLR